jgi:hypothetical protein
MDISNDVMTRLVAKAKAILEGYDGLGVDEWDAVMEDDLDGYDLNVYQDNENEPLSIFVYKVDNLVLDTSKWVDITNEVMKGDNDGNT